LNGEGKVLGEVFLGCVEGEVDSVEASVGTREDGGGDRDPVQSKEPYVVIHPLQV